MDIATLKQFGTAGSHYASYPSPDRFVEAFGAEEHASWLKKRGIGGFGRTLGLYVHAPYCDTSCAFCGRHNSVTHDRASWSRYLTYLKKEAQLKSGFLSDHSVVQIDWGGYIPLTLSDAEFRTLAQVLTEYFNQSERTERSIEVDPRNVRSDTVSGLASLGFNRLFVASRDFDISAPSQSDQDAIDAATEAVVEAARASGIKTVSIELIYGFPQQTVMSFNRVLQRTIAKSPERIAVINYPQLRYVRHANRARGKISETDMPDADTQLHLYSLAVTRLTQAGYVYIGMDRFAKPDDELAVAQRQGRLHRNFQGYLTHPDCDLLGLGVSSFSMVGPTYSQNARSPDEYYDRLDNDRLPVVRGVELTGDDLLRRTVMHALMCHFEVAFESVEIAHLVDFRKYFANEIEDLKVFVDAGLVQIDDKWLSVTDLGRYVVGAVCMVFDRYLREGRQRASSEKVL
jgi:oxygen-independent coproporphyrinogen-3 oxidase